MKGKDVLKYCAIKKVISLLLIIIMEVAGCLQQITINANEASQQEIIQNVLEDYFCDFLSTLKEDSQKDYSSEDFASINGYIIAKRFVTLRENYKVDFGGICAVEIEEIILDDLFAKDELLEAMVYVKYKYSWGDASEEDTCETGSLYRVTLEASDNTYQVIDLDNTSIEIRMAKNAIDSKTYNTAESYQQIDSFFDKIQQNAKETSETVIDSEVMEEEEQDICTTANNNVSYNATKAKNWGKKLGKHYENYIFKRATWDCTNFVSQWVWVGYGGTEGYTIPTDPTVKDSTCVALKQRVASIIE